MAILEGWIRSIRESKDITFLDTYKGLALQQVVIEEGTVVEGELKVGASFKASGNLKSNPQGKGNDFHPTKFTILGPSDDEYPIQPKEHSMEFLRGIPELRGRTRHFQNMWLLRTRMLLYLDHFAKQRGLQNYTTPILMGQDFEGPGLAIEAKTEWISSDLSVSGQLHLEVGMMSLSDVYTIAPCFRAEKSSGRRHLCEFWMLEAERAFKERHQVMEDCQYIISESLRYMVDGLPSTLREIEGQSTRLPWFISPTVKWPRVTYKEVSDEYEVPWGEDIPHNIELKLTVKYGTPVFVTDHPAAMKPFYMKTHGEKGELVKSFDLLLPEVGEVAGGSAREEDYEKLKKVMHERGLSSDMDWYLDTRRWGSVPHSGFGIGIDRLLMFITKTNNIRDVVPLPIAY